MNCEAVFTLHVQRRMEPIELHVQRRMESIELHVQRRMEPMRMEVKYYLIEETVEFYLEDFSRHNNLATTFDAFFFWLDRSKSFEVNR